VFADRGSAVIVDDSLVYFHTADQPQQPEEPPAHSVAGLGPAHEAQLRDLVQVVRARQQGDVHARPRVGTQEGRRALALVLAMYESARTGRAVQP
jgi:predicted dehydrogenase